MIVLCWGLGCTSVYKYIILSCWYAYYVPKCRDCFRAALFSHVSVSVPFDSAAAVYQHARVFAPVIQDQLPSD